MPLYFVADEYVAVVVILAKLEPVVDHRKSILSDESILNINDLCGVDPHCLMMVCVSPDASRSISKGIENFARSNAVKLASLKDIAWDNDLSK
jgi:hypothetical protein